MRTTLTLDPDVARMIDDEAHRQRKPVKQVVNEALRRGLSGSGQRASVEKYRLKPHRAKLRPGLDRFAFNRLADELETEATLARRTRKGKR